ncbi:rod shape-determining protein RodA [Alkalilimnicola sp. S0819]|uniref:rod shape-determining protein RodA n=1 Tax=Alkalilimnicola sp. S0819 TaxID=2613922 RepID=UPI001261CB1B|nr:rod shape-determining protein RodA [Alkalilimnicola sp. S0819]KAB7623769.1 rod shape-determining protein RodA [Alkalilimnicola sp. S0819]MPQ16641.1 rod shape-determining protein RodA [Alkalilimnicola sp. S0819]
MIGNDTVGRGSVWRQSWLQRHLHLDGTLLTLLALLSVFGLVVLYSAFDQDWLEARKQLVRLGAGFGAMAFFAQIPPSTLRRWTPWVFLGGVALLVAVLVIGYTGKGAQRWLDLGFMRFQPSEAMKLALPMMIAWLLADGSLPPRLPRLLTALGLIGLPVGLIMLQPDLGTSLLVASSGFFVLYLGGLRWRMMLGAALLGGAAAPLMWFFAMHDYQRERVLTFLNPERDPLGAGYHIIQSKIAIGSGGLFGKGWLNGTQSHLQFLPERHTDFIYAVLAEEFGLVGVAQLLVLYLLVIGRGLYIAVNAQDTYSRLLAGSLSLTFFVYIFVNAGMVSGLLPVVGLPLPLISYGGTSMVTLMAAFGMLMSIHTHRKLWSS